MKPVRSVQTVFYRCDHCGHIWECEPRRLDDRRARSLGGRRADDPSLLTHCPVCGDDRVEQAGEAGGVREMRCRICAETWTALPPH